MFKLIVILYKVVLIKCFVNYFCKSLLVVDVLRVVKFFDFLVNVIKVLFVGLIGGID